MTGAAASITRAVRECRMRTPILLALAFAILMPGAASQASPPADADPLAMFVGASQGRGTLKLGFGPARAYTVDNRGTRDADGTVRLAQVVHMPGVADHPRDWVIRPAGGGRYTFTLSDAVGPGVAVVDGARITLRFAPRHGVRLTQVLERSPDGATLSNHGRITVLGLPIGHLDETISRTSP